VSLGIEEMKRRALELVREAYSTAAEMRNVPLDVINRKQPPNLRYRSSLELVREEFAAANALATFAVQLGLLTSDQAAELLRESQRKNPRALFEGPQPNETA